MLFENVWVAFNWLNELPGVISAHSAGGGVGVDSDYRRPVVSHCGERWVAYSSSSGSLITAGSRSSSSSSSSSSSLSSPLFGSRGGIVLPTRFNQAKRSSGKLGVMMSSAQRRLHVIQGGFEQLNPSGVFFSASAA